MLIPLLLAVLQTATLIYSPSNKVGAIETLLKHYGHEIDLLVRLIQPTQFVNVKEEFR